MTLLAQLAPAAEGFAGGTLGTYAWAFGQGLLVDLTPCVYPLIPITVAVFGAKGVSRGRALFLATAYVLGMATLYTTLGVIVAMTGGQFGAWLGEPVVVLPIVALLLALAASMFGAFDLQLPSSVQTRLGAVGGAGPLGAFGMGLVSGFISAPCTGPVLLALLAYIAKASAGGGSSAMIYGGSLLFVYALGMGTLFFAVALGASLFRPGQWMEYIKSFFGVALLIMALWFLAPLSPALRRFMTGPEGGMYIGLGLVTVGLFAGAIHLSYHGAWGERLRKTLAVALAVVGAQITINNALYVPTGAWRPVATIAELEQAIQAAEDRQVPVLIDFGAEWCLPCKEMEVKTFHNPEVEPVITSKFELIRVDVTEETDEKNTIKKAFESQTLPSIVIYGSKTRLSEHFPALRSGAAVPAPDVRFKDLTLPAEFMAKIADVD
jgi:thiol:disulfide interchange protein DsbD